MTRSVGQIIRGYKSACTSLYKRYISPAISAGKYADENNNHDSSHTDNPAGKYADENDNHDYDQDRGNLPR